MSSAKFFVKISTKNSIPKRAKFGECLLDQLTLAKGGSCLPSSKPIVCIKSEQEDTKPTESLKAQSTIASISLKSEELGIESTNTKPCLLYGNLVTNSAENIAGEARLSCNVEIAAWTNDSVVLEESCAADSIILKHPPFCPVRRHSNSQEAPPVGDGNSHSGIVAAVSVLLLSREGDVLMTRRAPHMRTFPGIWVPPGGHVEAGESIAAAGLRELWEETGVKDHLCDPQVLCMWESVYPPHVSYGPPTRQHLVIYVTVQTKLAANEVTVKLESKEVDAGLWLPAHLIKSIIDATNPDVEHADDLRQQIPACLPGYSVDQSTGGTVCAEIDVRPIIERNFVGQKLNSSRISTGTKFALERYLLWQKEQNEAKIMNKLNEQKYSTTAAL